MRRIFIINNLMVIVVHVCICLVFLLPVAFMGGTGHLWTESMLEQRTTCDTAFRFIELTFLTVISFPLYFLAGRKFLGKADTIFTNMLSVVSIIFVVILSTVIAFANQENNLNMFMLLQTPNVLANETIAFFLRVDPKVVHLASSILPFLALLAGIQTQSYRFDAKGEY